MLHVAFSVVAVAASLPEQQPAEQLFEPSSQQSQLQFSQVQTPLSQQQPPSWQQLVQAQAFAASGEGLLAKFAPIAIPIPTTHNSTNVAATFMFIYLINDSRTVVYIEALALLLNWMLDTAISFTDGAKYFWLPCVLWSLSDHHRDPGGFFSSGEKMFSPDLT